MPGRRPVGVRLRPGRAEGGARLAARRRGRYDCRRLAVPQETPVRRWLFRFAAAIGAVFFLMPAHLLCQQIGVFFDSQATVCNAPIVPFGSVHAYLFAFIPPDSVVSGALLRVQFPPGISVHPLSLQFPRNRTFEAQGELASGLALRFAACESTPGPLQLAEFDLDDLISGETPRPNLRLRCEGFGVDSTATMNPQFRVCNPHDATGSDLRRFAARGVDAVLNCSSSCGCTTAVVSQAWSQIKALYREP
jgi:hypothetical protein